MRFIWAQEFLFTGVSIFLCGTKKNNDLVEIAMWFCERWNFKRIKILRDFKICRKMVLCDILSSFWEIRQDEIDWGNMHVEMVLISHFLLHEEKIYWKNSKLQIHNYFMLNTVLQSIVFLKSELSSSSSAQRCSQLSDLHKLFFAQKAVTWRSLLHSSLVKNEQLLRFVVETSSLLFTISLLSSEHHEMVGKMVLCKEFLCHSIKYAN